MKKTFLNKLVTASLVSSQLLAVAPAMSAQIAVVDSNNETTTTREFTEADAALMQAQLNTLANMSEEDLNLQLEIQAAQIEGGLKDAEAQGVVISPEQKEQLTGLAAEIHSLAAAPHKKSRLGRILMAIPRGVAQGLGYLGYAIGDLLFAPALIIGPFLHGLIAGESQKIVPQVLGFTGMFLGNGAGLLTSFIVLGIPAFPIAIGTMLPLYVTSRLICSRDHYSSPYTEKYCTIHERNTDMLTNLWEGSDAAGVKVHNVLAWPFKQIGKLFKRHR